MMMLTIRPTSPQAASWLAQRREFESLLDGEPANPLAWYWRFRVKLFTFLLARYANTPNLSSNEPRPAAPPCVVRKQKSAPLRSRTEIRRTLDDIAVANIERWLHDE